MHLYFTQYNATKYARNRFTVYESTCLAPAALSCRGGEGVLSADLMSLSQFSHPRGLTF